MRQAQGATLLVSMIVPLLVPMIVGACAGRPPPPWTLGEGEGEGDPPLSEVIISTAACDVGEVPLGTSRSCFIEVTNGGPREVEIVALTITSSTDVFSLPSPYTGALPVAASMEVRVSAHPVAQGPLDATLVIGFAGALVPERTIPLRVTGITGPDCVARVSSVNGAPVAVGVVPAIAPLDVVVLSLDESTVAPTSAITAFEWRLLSRPAGSTVQLTTPTAEATGFTFDDELGLDLAGTFRVRAEVFDSAGLQASCELELEAASPFDALQAQLSWDSPQADLDLHLRRHSDALCAAADCYALTCASAALDWGSPASSPRLDADAEGFGPETITLDAPADGVFLVAVHGRELPAPSNATVRVFHRGSLLFEGSAPVADDDAWHVAAISCVAGSCSASADGTHSALASCAP
ncbi:MAG: hypothetical protein IT383_13780 [Deltaproteobacteria bacterium]|nr:hypothetical protein [Deltaproteobacteria bacterium]